MTTTAEGIQIVLDQYGSLIDTYRGSIPAAVVAGLIWHESTNTVCPKPTACCDERGLMQVKTEDRITYGLNLECVPGSCEPGCAEENIRAGCQLWNNWTNSMVNKIGQPATEADLWKFSTAYRGIGPGALVCLWNAAGQPSDYPTLVNWVNAALADGTLEQMNCFGTQSASSIANRVNNINDRTDVALGSGGGGALGGDLGLVAVAALGVWLFLKYFKK